MHLVQGTPNAYIQESGILHQAGAWLSKFGTSFAIITGEKSFAAVEPVFTASLTEARIPYRVHHYQGECSQEEVNRLKSLLTPDVDLVVGVGGGKVIDVAKALAAQTQRELATVPTLAATCAAVTPLSVMYAPDGVYRGFTVWPRIAVLTLVDTEVMAHSPARYLASGVGDTLAKWYEALMSSSGKYANVPTQAGLQMAKLCLDLLRTHSEQALADVRVGHVSQAVEQVTDAIILISGAVGGFGETNCRSAAAHAVHNGLSVLPESHHALHGEKVAWGILVQLAIEGKSDKEILDLIRFYRACRLPSSLDELGISYQRLTEDQLREIARVSLLPESTMSSMPFTVSEDSVISAVKRVQVLSNGGEIDGNDEGISRLSYR